MIFILSLLIDLDSGLKGLGVLEANTDGDMQISPQFDSQIDSCLIARNQRESTASAILNFKPFISSEKPVSIFLQCKTFKLGNETTKRLRNRNIRRI